MYAHTGVGSSQPVRLVKPYSSVKCYFCSGDQVWGEHLWPVSVCRILTCKLQWTVRQSPCEFVVTVVTEACFTDCVFEISQANNILNHYWYVVLLIKDGMNHYCHLPHTINHRHGATGNELRLVSWLQDGSHVCSFVDFIARICFALALSSRWNWTDDSDVKAECMRTQAWVRRSLSGLWNHIPVWNVTFVVVIKFEVSIGDQFLSVEFWHVSYSGLCVSHLVNLSSRWSPRHASLIVYLKFHRQTIF